jgi:hypothetical protein
MPIAAKCPSCGAPLNETSVVALAPKCDRCGAVITSVGGTLGLTSAYGVGDPTITRRRVEADLAVFREYQMKYRGMLEACKQQLNWGVERYAQLPHPPELLELQEVPSFWEGVGLGLMISPLVWFGLFIASSFIIGAASPDIARIFPSLKELSFIDGVLFEIKWLAVLALPLSLWWGTKDHFKVKAANGNRPRENVRRQKAYEGAMAAALKAAEPLKAAEDHRLRCQIRELEGLAKTVGEKEADVRRILATL